MSANSLSFRYEKGLDGSGNGIVALLPVWAYECEVHPPYERELDAYEDAVLRMVRLGMGPNAMANALNSSQSLIGTVLSNLQAKAFIEKQPNKPWGITNDAQAYFDGYFQEQASENAQYGFMFVSALRKDVLPYYHQGPLDKVKLLDGGFALLLNGSEQETFTPFVPDNRALGRAYSNYRKAYKLYSLQDSRKISRSEAARIGEDVLNASEGMDEEEIANRALGADPAKVVADLADHAEKMRGRAVVRRLEKPAKRCWLRLRVVFDPASADGFRVESPFDLDGVDDSCYLRQAQWMMNSREIMLKEEPFQDFLLRESSKLASRLHPREIDYSFYVQDKMPLLKVYKDRFSKIYENFGNIYADIQEQDSLLDKENIVNQMCTKVLESLYRQIFQSVDEKTISIVQARALGEIETYKPNEYRERLIEVCNLPAGALSKNGANVVKNAAKNLSWSRGNSVLEKMYNLMMLYYYAPNDMVRRYVEMEDFLHYAEQVSDLNHIRNSVAHDANHSFTAQSYEEFMNKVYPVANRMIRTIVGGN